MKFDAMRVWVCSARGGMSEHSLNIIQNSHHMRTFASDITELSEMPAVALKRFKAVNEIK